MVWAAKRQKEIMVFSLLEVKCYLKKKIIFEHA
jgi:hypothetical protein